MSAASRRIDNAFERLAAVDSRLWSGVFFGAIGLYTLAVVVESIGYSADARLFPLVVGVPFLGLVALKLVLLAGGDRFALGSTELFDFQDRFDGLEGPAVDPAVRYRREFAMVVWLVGLTAVLWTFGYLLSLLVFIFTFIAVYDGDRRRAAVVAVATYAFVYLFFVRLLGARIYGGVLPLGIPGLTT